MELCSFWGRFGAVREFAWMELSQAQAPLTKKGLSVCEVVDHGFSGEFPESKFRIEAGRLRVAVRTVRTHG